MPEADTSNFKCYIELWSQTENLNNLVLETQRIYPLYDCPSAQGIWNQTNIWLTNVYAQTFHIDKKSVLIGNIQNEIIINYCFTIIKHEILKQKWNKNQLDLIKIKRILKNHMDLEIYIGTVKNNMQKVLGRWSTFYTFLK